MRYLGYEVCLLACRIAGVPDRQCNAFHRAQTCQPEGDSRSGFLPAGLPSFPVPRRAQRLLVFSFDYSACGQPIVSSDLAAYCSASSARAEFLQRVRRLLTGGSLRPACALGGNRLASLFQDEVLQQPLFLCLIGCAARCVFYGTTVFFFKKHLTNEFCGYSIESESS